MGERLGRIISKQAQASFKSYDLGHSASLSLSFQVCGRGSYISCVLGVTQDLLVELDEDRWETR